MGTPQNAKGVVKFSIGPIIRFLAPNLGKPFISLKLIQLER